MKTVMIY